MHDAPSPGAYDLQRRDPSVQRARAAALVVAANEGHREIEARFQRRFEELQRQAAEFWTTASTAPADLGPSRSLWSRWHSGRRLSRRVEEFRSRLGDGSSAESGAASEPGAEDVMGELPVLGRELVAEMGLGHAAGDLLTRSDMTRATEDFVRQARAEDPNLAAEDLGQALRNVWVIHFLQRLHAGSARHTQAALGYSLLYPYTDNVLDDPDRSPDQKRERSKRLGLRLGHQLGHQLSRQLGHQLGGAGLPPLDAAEARVFRQLDRIDVEYARADYPEVHLALQAIHRSQVESLRQQRAADPGLGQDELLRLTVAKGGSSVLVDSYLAAGRPSFEMTRFAFVYGVALQLADDLQDIETDLAAGHQTLFTRAAREGTLEPQFWRLVHFLDASLSLCPESCPEDRSPNAGLAGRDGGDLKALARASMVHLMIHAVGAQPRRFPRTLRRRVARHSPVTFARARALRRRLARLLNVAF